MGKKSEFTMAASNVLGEIVKLKNKPNQSIPFGTEKVSKETFQARLGRMGAQERAQLIETMGVDAILEALK